MAREDDIPTLDPYEDEIKARIRRIEKLADLLDSTFMLPGTTFRFGWDSLIGLVPVVGDTLTLIPQFYLLFEAMRLKVGGLVIMKMVLNIFIDWLVGLIPVLGDLFDVAFKSNLRNAKLVADALRKKHDDCS